MLWKFRTDKRYQTSYCIADRIVAMEARRSRSSSNTSFLNGRLQLYHIVLPRSLRKDQGLRCRTNNVPIYLGQLFTACLDTVD